MIGTAEKEDVLFLRADNVGNRWQRSQTGINDILNILVNISIIAGHFCNNPVPALGIICLQAGTDTLFGMATGAVSIDVGGAHWGIYLLCRQQRATDKKHYNCQNNFPHFGYSPLLFLLFPLILLLFPGNGALRFEMGKKNHVTDGR